MKIGESSYNESKKRGNISFWKKIFEKIIEKSPTKKLIGFPFLKKMMNEADNRPIPRNGKMQNKLRTSIAGIRIIGISVLKKIFAADM